MTRFIFPFFVLLLSLSLTGCGSSGGGSSSGDGGTTPPPALPTFTISSFAARADASPGSADPDAVGQISATIYSTDTLVVSAKISITTTATLTYADIPVQIAVDGTTIATVTPTAWTTIGTTTKTHIFTVPWTAAGTLSAGAHSLTAQIRSSTATIGSTGSGNSYTVTLPLTITAPPVGPG